MRASAAEALAADVGAGRGRRRSRPSLLLIRHNDTTGERTARLRPQGVGKVVVNMR